MKQALRFRVVVWICAVLLQAIPAMSALYFSSNSAVRTKFATALNALLCIAILAASVAVSHHFIRKSLSISAAINAPALTRLRIGFALGFHHFSSHGQYPTFLPSSMR